MNFLKRLGSRKSCSLFVSSCLVFGLLAIVSIQWMNGFVIWPALIAAVCALFALPLIVDDLAWLIRGTDLRNRAMIRYRYLFRIRR